MKNFLQLFIFIFIIINFKNNSLATSGSGELKFSPEQFNSFLAYMRGDGDSKGEVGKRRGTPLAFAINTSGNYSFYYYCPMKWAGSCYPGDMAAMRECTKISKKRGSGRCYVFAKKRKIVWDSKNIKLRAKFDEDAIRRVFKENNWFGTTNNKKKILNNVENKPKINKKKNSGKTTVEQLKELNELFQSGALTQEEFTQAKKKLLD